MTSTYRKKMKNKKPKRKLRKLTSIMPMLEWRPDIEQVHMFRMPFKVGGMKDLQLHTPIKSRKKKVWANVYQKLSKLPSDIYMKDIEFGFIPKDNYMGYCTDKHKIVWINEQVNIPFNEIIGLALRGTAIYYSQWCQTYNPYVKYNRFTIDVLRNNRRMQMSLPSIVKSYKDSGTWEEIRSVRDSINEITTSDTLMDMWNCFSGNQFIVPNPITSMRIFLAEEKPYFNFLLSKDTTERHCLQKHISLPPKRQTPYSKVEFEKEYKQRISFGELLLDENPTRSDGTRQEEDDPF